VDVTPEGLADALRELAGETSELLKVRCIVTGETRVEVADAAVAGNAYLIAREAVNNAVKHGQAANIEIGLSVEAGWTVLRIADDGSGIVKGAQGKGMGLRVMQYRADIIGATLDISPGSEGGTVVTCVLPESADQPNEPNASE
jgi:two-component system, LuxR family, sensor kinase FixL